LLDADVDPRGRRSGRRTNVVCPVGPAGQPSLSRLPGPSIVRPAGPGAGWRVA